MLERGHAPETSRGAWLQTKLGHAHGGELLVGGRRIVARLDARWAEHPLEATHGALLIHRNLSWLSLSTAAAAAIGRLVERGEVLARRRREMLRLKRPDDHTALSRS